MKENWLVAGPLGYVAYRDAEGQADIAAIS